MQYVTIPLSRRGSLGRYPYRLLVGPKQFQFLYYDRPCDAWPHQILWTKIIVVLCRYGFIKTQRSGERIYVRRHFSWRREGPRLPWLP